MKYLVRVEELTENACGNIGLAVEQLCEEPVCIGHRMCHRKCMLKEWFRMTGDPNFNFSCAGRCVGWDLVLRPEEHQDERIESWYGWHFIRCPEVDMESEEFRLGLHSQHCFWAGKRNTVATCRSKKCQHGVLSDDHANQLKIAQQKLQLTAQELSKSSARLNRLLLRTESVLQSLARTTASCGARLQIEGEVFHCRRIGEHPKVRAFLESARADVYEVFHVLSTVAVLGSLLETKVVMPATSLPVNLALVPEIDAPARQDDESGGSPQDTCTEVIQPVFHPEPPAIIPPEEAQVFVDVQEAGLISRMIDKTMDSDHQADPGCDPILLGRVNRMPHGFRAHLAESNSLRQCRRALEEQNLPTQTAEGALLFIKPDQYPEVCRAVRLSTLTLSPSDIIFAFSFEYLLAEAFDSFNGNGQGCWLRSQKKLEANSAEDLLNLSSDSGRESRESSSAEYTVCVHRSFLVCMPTRAMDDVTVSTTDLRGPNPRQAVQRINAGQ